jgi:hypothetical protein
VVFEARDEAMADGLTTARMIQREPRHRNRRVRAAAQPVFCHLACYEEPFERRSAGRHYEQLRLTRLTRQALNPLKMTASGKAHSRFVNADRYRMHGHLAICRHYIIDSWIHTTHSNRAISKVSLLVSMMGNIVKKGSR